jgi:hypothetical protein
MNTTTTESEKKPRPATRLTITVKSPATQHELRMAKLDAWLTGGAKSPREQVDVCEQIRDGCPASR